MGTGIVVCCRTPKGEEEKEPSGVVVSCTFVNHPEKNRAKNKKSRMRKNREIETGESLRKRSSRGRARWVRSHRNQLKPERWDLGT
jgi:hypothetical protein